MRKFSFAAAVVLACVGGTPSFAMTIPNVEATSANPIILASGPCQLGFDYDAYRGKCRSARFGFGRSYYPGRRCVIRYTPYGPRRFCR